MVLGEALVIGVLATGVAAVLGPVFGRWLFGQFTSGGFISPEVQFHQGWIPMLIAAGATLLAVGISALVAGFRVGRIRPTEALAEASVPRGWLTPLRLVVAILCFGGGTALGIVTLAVMTGPIAASTAGPAVMLWAIGVAMISPGVTKLTAILLQGPMRLFSGVIGWLAITNTRNAATRVAGAVTPIMLAVGIATANIYLQTTTTAASAQAFAEDLRADAVVAGPTGVSPEALERVRHADGVAAVSTYVTSRAFITEPFDENQTKRATRRSVSPTRRRTPPQSCAAISPTSLVTRSRCPTPPKSPVPSVNPSRSVSATGPTGPFASSRSCISETVPNNSSCPPTCLPDTPPPASPGRCSSAPRPASTRLG